MVITNKQREKIVMKIVVLFLTLITLSSYAMEDIITPKQGLRVSQVEYSMKLLRAALEATEAEYGKTNVKKAKFLMSRKRRLVELVKGNQLHVSAHVTSTEWEKKLIPVYIPIQKGILGYRLFLLHKDNKGLLSGVKNLTDLKWFTTGVGDDWTIHRVLKANKFNTVAGRNLPSLYKMLEAKRFQTFSRGVHELDLESKLYPNPIIDEHIALYTPLPRYFFVTPNRPELAKRIQKGLLAIIESGKFEELFSEYHAAILEMVDLDNRRTLVLENPELSEKTLESIRNWYPPVEGD
jgi:hypothetical protein